MASSNQPPADATLCTCTGVGVAGPKRPVEFTRLPPPEFHRAQFVCYVHPFHIHKTRSKHWLLPKKAACSLLWIGVIFVIAGLISLQIANILRHSISSDCFEQAGKDSSHCRQKSIAELENQVKPVGIICMGLGSTMILLSAFLFFHAHCIVYEGSPEHARPEQQEQDVEASTNVTGVLAGSQFFKDTSKRPGTTNPSRSTGMTLTVPTVDDSRKPSIVSFSPPVHLMRAQQSGPALNGRR